MTVSGHLSRDRFELFPVLSHFKCLARAAANLDCPARSFSLLSSLPFAHFLISSTIMVSKQRLSLAVH